MRTVRLVADPYPPYQYEQDGRVRGADHEIIVQAFRACGLAARTSLLPWKQCLESLQEKRADGIYQILPNPERRKLYLFSGVLREERTLLFRRAGGPAGSFDPAAGDPFRGRLLGVLGGYSYGPAVDRLSESQKAERAGQEQLLRALLAGEVDLILMDAGVAAYLARKLGIQGIEQVPAYQINRPLHVAFQRDRAGLARLFDSGLEAVRQKGVYRRVLESYGLPV